MNHLLIAALFSSLACGQEVSYSVQYTARTIGFARIPDLQTLGSTDPGEANSAAKAYSQLFAGAKTVGPMVRLGMGDNFAPYLLARVYKMPGGTGPAATTAPKNNWCHPDDENILVPKDRFFFDPDTKQWVCANDPKIAQNAKGATRIDYDNVAQFFITNRYQAMTPGKHDFYFGPEWLRDLARFLATGGVHMLGANLYISTVRAPQAQNSYPSLPDRFANAPFENEFGAVNPNLPDVVFPYKRQFVIKNARQILSPANNALVPATQLARLERKDVTTSPLINDVQICGETGRSPRDPRNIPLPGAPHSDCKPLVASEIACAAGQVPAHLQSSCAAIYKDQGGVFDTRTSSSHPSPDETYLFQKEGDKLAPDTNYLLCGHLKALPDKWTCQTFSAQLPFFSFGDSGQRPKPGESDLTTPYELVETQGLRIAIFGVVDPDLLTNVGLVNDAWLNTNRRLDTAVQVAPADYTLQQALELCNSHEECRQARKIVMAQMSWAKAGQLIVRFGDQIDLAISQADDDHDLGTGSRAGSIPSKPGPRLLISPPNPGTQEGAFTPKLSVAKVSLTTKGSGKDGLVSWTLGNSVTSSDPIPDELSMCANGPCLSVGEASHAAISRAKALPTSSVPQPLAVAPSLDVRNLALMAMRNTLKTDVAFLQKRDMYNADYLSSLPIPVAQLQNQLQRIFWKGDFVVTLHATGATLRKIMKQSKKFASLDNDALSTETERGRELFVLGLKADPNDDDTLYINGTPMDDVALYSIAATQYLGLGDTGYGDLASPDVPPAYRVEDFGHIRPLAGLICDAIDATKLYAGLKCDRAVLTRDYFDFVDPQAARPLDESPGFDAAHRYKTLMQSLINDGSVPIHGIEGRVQQRPFLAINLENLDLAYGGTYLNHVQSVSNTFPGITAPGVVTTGNNSLASDHRARVIYDFRRGTFYGLSESSFMRTSTTSGNIASITTNLDAFEGGGTIRLLSPKRPAWLSLQYSGRFEGQLADPSPTKVSSTYLPSPQSSTVSGRLGLRLDHGDTYLETGFEEVDSRHVLTQYAFSDGTTCAPSPRAQLACQSSLFPSTPVDALLPGRFPTGSPQVLTADFLTGGAYLNFIFKFPLWSRQDSSRADQGWYFTVTNRGDLFFNSHSDTGTQTRYLDKLTPSFSIPLYGKLSLTPKVDMILYENKVFRNHYRALVPSLSLSYTFNWRQGMAWDRALGFGAISTAAGTAGSLPSK